MLPKEQPRSWKHKLRSWWRWPFHGRLCPRVNPQLVTQKLRQLKEHYGKPGMKQRTQKRLGLCISPDSAEKQKQGGVWVCADNKELAHTIRETKFQDPQSVTGDLGKLMAWFHSEGLRNGRADGLNSSLGASQLKIQEEQGSSSHPKAGKDWGPNSSSQTGGVPSYSAFWFQVFSRLDKAPPILRRAVCTA